MGSIARTPAGRGVAQTQVARLRLHRPSPEGTLVIGYERLRAKNSSGSTNRRWQSVKRMPPGFALDVVSREPATPQTNAETPQPELSGAEFDTLTAQARQNRQERRAARAKRMSRPTMWPPGMRAVPHPA